MRAIRGTLTCHRLARHRRGGSSSRFLGHLIADLIQPLPPRELWVVSVLDPTAPFKNDDGQPYRIYRTKSGKLPGLLDPTLEGTEVTLLAHVEPWSNGLGGYISRVKLVER